MPPLCVRSPAQGLLRRCERLPRGLHALRPRRPLGEGAGSLSSVPASAVITLDVDPFIEIGPLTLAWHGAMIAVGLGVGLWFARRHARRVGLEPDELTSATLWLAFTGIVGARAFWLAENGALTSPAE